MSVASPQKATRRTTLGVLLAASFLLFGAPALAQDGPGGPGGSGGSGGSGGPGGPAPGLTPERIDERVTEMTQRVELTDAQQASVRRILQDSARRTEEVRQGTQPRSRARGAAMRGVMHDTDDQIWALLSCEQKDAYRLYKRDLRMRRMASRHGRRGHGHGRGGMGGMGGMGGSGTMGGPPPGNP